MHMSVIVTSSAQCHCDVIGAIHTNNHVVEFEQPTMNSERFSRMIGIPAQPVLHSDGAIVKI